MLPLAATATLTGLLLAWLSPVALPNGFIGNIWLSAAARWWRKLAGIKNSLPLAGALTGSLACENLSAIADSRTAGDERGDNEDAALRIHPRVAR